STKQKRAADQALAVKDPGEGNVVVSAKSVPSTSTKAAEGGCSNVGQGLALIAGGLGSPAPIRPPRPPVFAPVSHPTPLRSRGQSARYCSSGHAPSGRPS